MLYKKYSLQKKEHDDLEEFCMEILRFNLDNSPGIFLEIIDEKHYKFLS